MPFIGKDWRSPGEAWIKTESLGWQRMKTIESQLCDLAACHPNKSGAATCSWPPSPRNQPKYGCAGQQQLNSKKQADDEDKCDEMPSDCEKSLKRDHSASPEQSQDGASVRDQSRALSPTSSNSRCGYCYYCCSSNCCYPSSQSNERRQTTVWCHHSQHCPPGEPQLAQKTAPHCRISVRTKEVAMYNTISEAFYRLDFYNAIHDVRRFNYICKLLHLLITQNLTSLSGCATRVLFTMLEQVAREVSTNKHNINVIRTLLADIKQTIQKYSCWGRPIGSSLLWRQHFETIDRISQIVDEIELAPPPSDGSQVTFDRLPVEMIREILLRLNDYRDLVNSAKASPVMRMMIDNECVWQKLCRYHFTDQQLKLALESNKFNLVKSKQQQGSSVKLRGIKYARTTSADGRSSYRSPVVLARQKRNPSAAMADVSTSSSLADQRQSRSSADPNSTTNSSSYVTNAVRMFDKDRRQSSSSPSLQQATTRLQSDPRAATTTAAPLAEDADDCCRPWPLNGSTNDKTTRRGQEIDWERVFHQLRKRFGLKEEYADCLLLCRHCRCLFWKSFGHPCVKGDESIRRTNSVAAATSPSPTLDACCHCHAPAGVQIDEANLSNKSPRNDNQAGGGISSHPSSLSSKPRPSRDQASGSAQISVALLSRNFDKQSLGGANDNDNHNDTTNNEENTLLATNSRATDRRTATAAVAAATAMTTTMPTTRATLSSAGDASDRQHDKGSRPSRQAAESADLGRCRDQLRRPLSDLGAQLREHNFNRNQRQEQHPRQAWQQQLRHEPTRRGSDAARDNVGTQRKRADELVPKHVTISPQAFLKFFSL